MSHAPESGRTRFRRRLFGYSISQVDEYLTEAVAARRAVEEQLAMSTEDPMDRVAGEVSAVIQTFAASVAKLQEEAAHEAQQARLEADQALASATAFCDSLKRRAEVEARALVADALLETERRFEQVVAQRQVAERALAEAEQALWNAHASLAAVEAPNLDEVHEAGRSLVDRIKETAVAEDAEPRAPGAGESGAA
jgi:hypothetical protein